MFSYDSIYLQALGSCIPERLVTNDELIAANQLRIKSSWIEGRLGLKTRAWAKADQAASDLALESMKNLGPALEEHPIYLSTISQDYWTPSTSSELKRKLGWTGNKLALDCSAACSGFVFALTMAANHLAASQEPACYAVATEVRSRFLNPSDRRTVFLFADAAAAAKLSRSPQGALARLLWTSPQTISTGEAEIYIPGGGSKEPLTEESVRQGRHWIQMRDGGKIEDTIDQFLAEKITETLALRGEKVSDYGYFLFHQGHAHLIYMLCEKLGIDRSQTKVIFDTYGNSTSASVGVAFDLAKKEGLIKKGSKVLLVTMGAGYHLGFAGFAWDV